MSATEHAADRRADRPNVHAAAGAKRSHRDGTARRHQTDGRADGEGTFPAGIVAAEAVVLDGLARALGGCAEVLAVALPDVSAAWAAANRILVHCGRSSSSPPSEAEMLLLDTAVEPLTPAWLVVDGLIALVVEQLPANSPLDLVIAVDRSLEGLRRLSDLIRVNTPVPR